MAIFFTSDTHFGHENIVHLGEGRPFVDVGRMDRKIMQNIFEAITPTDTLYHLGDAAMGDFTKTVKLLAMIPGKKFLVPGNHDKIFPKLNTAARIERFTPMYEDAGFTILPLHAPLEVELTDGEKIKVLLSHVPYSPERYEGRADRLAFARPVDDGKFLISGHTHAASPTGEHPREYNVGVDAHDYKPVPLATIVEWIERQRAAGY